MQHFLNGISLFFNPQEARKLYFRNQAQHESHWLTAFAYLSQAYHAEKKAFDSKKGSRKKTSS
jgi:hypothetical protein